MIDIEKIRNYERNARTHSDQQIGQIKQSIRRFCFVGAVVYDEQGLIAGHGRKRAVVEMWAAGEDVWGPGRREKLPKGKLPGVDASGLSEDERRALVIADNQLALNAGWNDAMLMAEVKALAEIDFDLTVLGFDNLDQYLLDGDASEPPDPTEPPENPVSRLGDIWILGTHRLVCGDSTDADVVAKCLNGAVPHLMVTDPPYGVEYDARWRKDALPDTNPGKTGGMHGKVSNDDNAEWSEAWALFPGDVAYCWHAGVKSAEVQQSFEKCGFQVRAQIIWAKHQSVIGRGHYHVQHEPCFYLVKKGGTGHWGGSRKQHTLWRIDKPQKSETGHSTQKPVECMKRPIENNSKVGDSVYEPFCGSGTTIVAGEMTGRAIYAIELNPAYIDVSVIRWEQMTGKQATLDGEGKTFAEVGVDRAKPA